MAELQSSSYDDVPYLSKPLYPTHPDCVGALAALMGLDPVPPERCRVLELGCATGENLLPMALAYPDSEFLGIDLAPNQIEVAEDSRAALRLDNLRFQAASILDVDESWGLFDYVICHGVYSWVPEVVRQKILSICRSNMSPRGVAYVSYNTYPGWHQRRAVRDMMRFHVSGNASPMEKVRQAREFLNVLAQGVSSKEAGFRHALEEEIDRLSTVGDYYIFHEHLEAENTPFWFHEFIAQSEAAGLQFLGESYYHLRPDDLSKEAVGLMQQSSETLVQMEQYQDFFRNRTFRRTLLVHQGLEIPRCPSAAIFRTLRATALAKPADPNAPILDESPLEFRGDQGAAAVAGHPAFKFALMQLYIAWPASIRFLDLVERTWSALEPTPFRMPREHLAAALGDILTKCYLSNLAALHISPPSVVVDIPDRPMASRLARRHASQGNRQPTNLRHRVAPIEDLELWLLPQLDGSVDRAGLLARMQELANQGKLTVQPADGVNPSDSTFLSAALDASLQNLARAAFLTADARLA